MQAFSATLEYCVCCALVASWLRYIVDLGFLLPKQEQPSKLLGINTSLLMAQSLKTLTYVVKLLTALAKSLI